MELVGSRFGHIRIVDVLGEGGMGSVYVGFDEKLQRRVAVKALHRERRLDKVAKARLMREARSLSQLDHPNICRIFDYIEDKDVDLLVLELIEGKTLQKAFAGGISRADKIRIAIDIAKALEVAHRRGIVHRDLKPDNVMLTDSGEVKVLDFGLARWLDQPQAAPVVQTKAEEDDEFGWAFLDGAESDSGRKTAVLDYGIERTQDVAATAAGITLGTPLYMSPEQARGEHLTPASDMYSFGLLLQTLFTERDPYPMDILGSEVMKRAARGESLPMTGDHAITALVNRLKQLAPTDRLTAHETVARLEYIADAPRRKWRRAIAAAVIVIVVLAAWKYTIDLRRERAAAVAAQHEAEHRRAQADDLIEFMLGDLRTKLEPVGSLDVLDGAATKALSYLTTLHKETMTVGELVRAAKGLNQLGEVRIGQGKLNEALPAFTNALQFAEAAARRDPTSVDAQLAVGTTHFWIGNVERLHFDYPHALTEMETYRSVAEKLSLANPGESALAIERAAAETNVGAIREAQGDLRGALKHYEKTMAIKQAEADRRPSSIDLQAELARTVNKLGVVRQKLGDLDEARRYFETEVSIYERVLRTQPNQNIWRQRLSNAHSFLAGVLEDLGSDAVALEHRRIELAIDEELCRLDSTNADWQRNLAVANVKVALLLRDRDRRGAIASCQSAEADMKAVLKRDPSRVAWLRDIAGIHWAAARVYLAEGDVESARKLADEALLIYRKYSTAGSGKLHIAEVLIISGDIATARQERKAAAAAWSEAAQIVQPLTGSSEPAVLTAWIRILTRLGRVSEAQPLAVHLAAMHYGNPEILSLIRKRDGS